MSTLTADERWPMVPSVIRDPAEDRPGALCDREHHASSSPEFVCIFLRIGRTFVSDHLPPTSSAIRPPTKQAIPQEALRQFQQLIVEANEVITHEGVGEMSVDSMKDLSHCLSCPLSSYCDFEPQIFFNLCSVVPCVVRGVSIYRTARTCWRSCPRRRRQRRSGSSSSGRFARSERRSRGDGALDPGAHDAAAHDGG